MNNNNEHYTKQLTLNFNAVGSDKATAAVVIDLNAARKNKDNSTKEKAITALLKEAERLTW